MKRHERHFKTNKRTNDLPDLTWKLFVLVNYGFATIALLP
jgi:hypothetical protein